MNIWVAKNKNAGKKVLMSDYAIGGPFFEKEYSVWLYEPEIIEEDGAITYLSRHSMTIDEKTLEELFSFSNETKMMMAKIFNGDKPRKFKVQVVG